MYNHGSSAEPHGSSAEPHGSSAEPHGPSAEPHGPSAEPQVAAIQILKESLLHTPEAGSVVRPLENVEEELQREKPDPKRIEKWLETAKHGLKSLALTKESDAGKV